MLCQTIELTKDLEKCPPSRTPKSSSTYVKALGKKLYFGFVRKKQLILITLANNCEIWFQEGQYVGGHFYKSFVSSIIWQSVSNVI